MIPRHRPSFGMGHLVYQFQLGMFPAKIEAAEEIWATRLKIPHAIWVPSGRYAICRSLEFATSDECTVYTPAFTCGVVREAVRRSGRRLKLMDSEQNGLLMSGDADRSATRHDAVILSEVYGLRYSDSDLPTALIDAGMRIFDMAMSVPTQNDMQRLRKSDVAIVSFGLGKPLYAGWGGLLLTHDQQMANWMRAQRCIDLAPKRLVRSIRQNTELLLRSAAHVPACYGLIRTLQDRLRRGSSPVIADGNSADDQLPPMSRDWSHGPTSLHLTLASNLARGTDRIISQRRQLLRSYETLLFPDSSVPVPEAAFSHYPIRVPGLHRDALRAELWENGIDTATLFEFPRGERPESFPNAHRHSHEILALPLWNSLPVQAIATACRVIRDFCLKNQISISPFHWPGEI
ncbi:MAG: DegT/DnrJ/EryC1/StrS aminotransferase family protein, partial [Planctomycetaceae bacterium]|nr:DegT/DnrJ/EryC1/StrS aminotransferase family protein [Planctomycetaceae bacterium]